MKALKYRKAYIEDALLIVSELNNEQKIVKLLDFKVGEILGKSYVKFQLQSIYDTLGIRKTAKATDLSNWYSIKDCEKTIEGKREKMLKIITVNVR